MTTSSPRSPRLLLVTTLVLAVAGVFLLAQPHMPSSSASSAPPPAAASAARPSSPSPGERSSVDGAAASATAAAVPAESAIASALPPHGEGAAGDRAIQQALEAVWPADLAAEDERHLLTAGRELLRADATGIGRAKWPGVFRDSGQALAPAFATARFRIQAAIARRDDSPDTAVVHLVWAGADRGGTYTDGRITDLFFNRTVRKGESAWTPLPRI
ncbi:hypothetical protein OG800_49025 [Streptomyces sp. NBC_00445]|uniref:hypothetical protein n=1 Tax=Streptomyces sp. NBC_00445 TaxID=2975745 RepID=UPI002E1B8B52